MAVLLPVPQVPRAWRVHRARRQHVGAAQLLRVAAKTVETAEDEGTAEAARCGGEEDAARDGKLRRGGTHQTEFRLERRAAEREG